MKAAIVKSYGGADTVEIAEMPRPVAGPGDVVVRVHAAMVTTADWRIRAADFPGVMALPGRLLMGIFRPRRPVLGSGFAGRVAEVGAGVTGFAPGDRVTGFAIDGGAHADFVKLRAEGPLVPTPAGLSDEEAAALPFGGLTALVFLRDMARLVPGERVLIAGGSGGVGLPAVQIARAMGAEVTALARAENRAMLERLGASEVVDYRERDVTTEPARFDVILDTVGALPYPKARRILTGRGRFLPLEFAGREMWQALVARLLGHPPLILGVSGDKREDLEALAAMAARDELRPVVEQVLPLDRAAEAHRLVESRHRSGAVVLRMTPDLAVAA